MTNYNDRLDKILKNLNNKARKKRASCTERNNWGGYNFAYERLESEAKQAINQLIKELVAESKPKNNWLKGSDLFYGQDEGVGEFEQNLLKALEEV